MAAVPDPEGSFAAGMRHGQWLRFLPSRFREPAMPVVVFGALTVLTLLAAPHVDKIGGDALDAAFKRALGALAATRALDSAISLAQSSEVSFSFGPGGSLGIGQALDPINDLVEQYGSLLLTSTTALGIQQLGLRMGRGMGWWLFVPGMVTLAFSVAVRAGMRETCVAWGRRLFALALVARLAIPVTAWIDAAIAKQFLEADYQEATAMVQVTTDNLQKVEASDADVPWYERYNPLRAVGDRAKQLYESLGNVGESIVNLAIYFTISTIVLPLATLWLLSKMVVALVRQWSG